MPELPEVETIRQDLRRKILFKRIKRAEATTKARLIPTRTKWARILRNKQFLEINRIGKLLIFVLSQKQYLLIHLKMSGQLIYRQAKQVIAGGHSNGKFLASLPNKFTRVIFYFSDGSELFFNDIRRFGYLKIVDEIELKKEKEKFGIEPLTADFTLKNFRKTLQGKKTNIKATLLNQKLLAGIGNIYADEICFAARIRPDAKINHLTNKQIYQLFWAIQKIIKQAVRKRGTTFNNFVDADGHRGNYVAELMVYGRAGENCRQCRIKLVRTQVAGRGTVYCPRCQK